MSLPFELFQDVTSQYVPLRELYQASEATHDPNIRSTLIQESKRRIKTEEPWLLALELDDLDMWKFLVDLLPLTDEDKDIFLEIALRTKAVKIGAQIVKEVGLDRLQEVYFQGSEMGGVLTPGQLVATDAYLFDLARCHERTMNNEPSILVAYLGPDDIYNLDDVWNFIKRFGPITPTGYRDLVNDYVFLLLNTDPEAPKDRILELFNDEDFVGALAFVNEEELLNYSVGGYLLEHPTILASLSSLAEMARYIGNPCPES